MFDNACNTHNYALNRDPVFFKDAAFIVDKFHWANHCGLNGKNNITFAIIGAFVNHVI